LGGKSHNFLFSKMKNIYCQVDRARTKYGKWAETLHICQGMAVADNSNALETEVKEKEVRLKGSRLPARVKLRVYRLKNALLRKYMRINIACKIFLKHFNI